jgi:hypothetical protein
MVNKRDSNDPRQLSLFGELPSSSDPSIATFPEFDQALNNLIKLSDLGAFIEINIQGFEKGYTLNLSESIIPKDFLKIPKNYSPITVQLFSHDLRNELKKLTYEIKAFFTPRNSFKTPFGYFLFRSDFSNWKLFLSSKKDQINEFLNKELSGGVYGKYFLEHFTRGYEFIESLSDITAPWEFRKKLLLKDIQESRKQMRLNNTTLSSLKHTELDFPFSLMVFKTMHIPMVLHQYQSQLQIHSRFKTIHLEYLIDRDINTIEDIRKLADSL